MRELNDPKSCLAVVILTSNEEKNLPYALASIRDWADEVFVLDSFSTDRTVEIAREAGYALVQNTFINYAKQRNFAIDRLPIRAGWVFFLDADEWLPQALRDEIRALIASDPEENGYCVRFRQVWMGCWVRRGYYPTWILRLFKRGTARCEERAVNEHLIVEGKVGYLKNDLIHEDRKGLDNWIAKHNRYATREALELIERDASQEQDQISARVMGTQAERKRWLRRRIWNRLPPLVRPFFYFFYRYVLTGAFLEGRAAFVFHFLHALWYPLLIDAKYLEMKRAKRKESE